MLKSLKQSFRSLSANPVRTVLTTLGIVIGISTVILVLSAGAGFKSLINSQLAAFGTNTVFIETRVPPTTKNRAAGVTVNSDISRATSAVAITTFKQRDLDSIKKLGNVDNAYGMVVGLAVASYRNNAKNVIYYGASAERFSIDQHTLKEGRFYSVGEDSGASQVAVLGSNLANDLFNQDDPLGKLIRIGNLNFQVIGVYNPQGVAGGGNADDSLYMPLATAQKKMLGIDYIAVGVVSLKDSNLGQATAAEIANVMRSNHNISDPAKDDFTVTTQAQAMDTFNTIFGGITILLICISAISLVVGGVGIMNIMYVVVTERTSEIGLKKALGAKKSDILSEFLIEAILVTVLGGIIGIAGGAFLGWIVSYVANANGLTWAFSVPFYAIAIGVGVSGAIGTAFGVLPANSAAKMDPVEALRYEQ